MIAAHTAGAGPPYPSNCLLVCSCSILFSLKQAPSLSRERPRPVSKLEILGTGLPLERPSEHPISRQGRPLS